MPAFNAWGGRFIHFFVSISTVNCDMNVLVPVKSIGRYMHDCIQLYMQALFFKCEALAGNERKTGYKESLTKWGIQIEIWYTSPGFSSLCLYAD